MKVAENLQVQNTDIFLGILACVSGQVGINVNSEQTQAMKLNVERAKQMKRPYERAVRHTISMPGLLSDRAQDKSRANGYSTFSDYIQDLVRRDTTEKKELAA